MVDKEDTAFSEEEEGEAEDLVAELQEEDEVVDLQQETNRKVSGKTIAELDEVQEREAMRRIEAVLFVSGRFLNISELISYTNVNPILLKELLEKLGEEFDQRESALELVQKNNLWKMDVRADYSDIINKLATGSSEFTDAEKETLAIIAYKQPIKQSVVIKIRGNKAYDHIKKYVDLGLVKRKKVGHTHDLSLSDEFYDYFNVQKRDGEQVNVVSVPSLESAE